MNGFCEAYPTSPKGIRQRYNNRKTFAYQLRRGSLAYNPNLVHPLSHQKPQAEGLSRAMKPKCTNQQIIACIPLTKPERGLASLKGMIKKKRSDFSDLILLLSLWS